MKINIEKLDPKHRITVERIENKPHVNYIRYLLTKGYSPTWIKQELHKLGLSAPHEPNLTVYYLAVIDPVIKKHGLSYLYADYKNRILKAKSARGEYSKNIINYRLKLGNDPDGQIKFCEMVKELEIDTLWIDEIHRFYGSVTNMPTYEDGTRILAATGLRNPCAPSIERILTFDKRYIIDKFLLESIPVSRIAEYCRTKLKLNVTNLDVMFYKNAFFNIKAQTVEDKINSLVNEKNSLKQNLSDLNEGIGEFETLTMGERITLREQTEKRINDLENSIRGLNALYKDASVGIAQVDTNNFESMFADIVGKSYQRFTDLDRDKDRDVVDPLYKTVRMMIAAHDKVETIKAASSSTDKHSQGTLLSLYGARVEEIYKEQQERVAKETNDDSFGDIDINEIAGIEETGINLEDEDN